MRLLPVLPVLVALGVTPTAAAPPAIGSRVQDFSLRDINGRQHSLGDDCKAYTAVVIVFVGTECPLANLYLTTLADLHHQYAGKGIQFLAINSNDQDSAAEVAAHARERKVPFPVLRDEGHRAADALGARRTPEACLVDSHGILRYRGRIDDQYGYTYRRSEPRRTELKDAIEDLLAGRPVATPQTEVQGCIIARHRPEANKHPMR